MQFYFTGNKHKNKLQPKDQTEEAKENKETKEKETASVNGKSMQDLKHFIQYRSKQSC